MAFPRSYLHVEGPPAHAWKTGQSLGSALPCWKLSSSPLRCHVRTLSPSSSSLGVAAPEPWGFFGQRVNDTHGAKQPNMTFPEEVTRRGHPTPPGNLQILKLTIPKTSQKRHQRLSETQKNMGKNIHRTSKNSRISRLQLHGLAANLLFFTCSARTSVFHTQEMVSKLSAASSFQVLPQRAWLDIVGPASSFKNRFGDAIPCHSTGAVPTSGI